MLLLRPHFLLLLFHNLFPNGFFPSRRSRSASEVIFVKLERDKLCVLFTIAYLAHAWPMANVFVFRLHVYVCVCRNLRCGERFGCAAAAWTYIVNKYHYWRGIDAKRSQKCMHDVCTVRALYIKGIEVGERNIENRRRRTMKTKQKKERRPIGCISIQQSIEQ